MVLYLHFILFLYDTFIYILVSYIDLCIWCTVNTHIFLINLDSICNDVPLAHIENLVLFSICIDLPLAHIEILFIICHKVLYCHETQLLFYMFGCSVSAYRNFVYV